MRRDNFYWIHTTRGRHTFMLGFECWILKNSHRIQQKSFSNFYFLFIIIPRLVISYQLKAFKKPRFQNMFLPKLKQSSAYQGLESIKHNLKPRLFKCFQLIWNHKYRHYIQKVKVTDKTHYTESERFDIKLQVANYWRWNLWSIFVEFKFEFSKFNTPNPTSSRSASHCVNSTKK